MYISIAFFWYSIQCLVFYGSSPYVAAYAHVIIHFSSVFANCGVKFLFTSCNLLKKKSNVLSIGDDDHMFVVR